MPIASSIAVAVRTTLLLPAGSVMAVDLDQRYADDIYAQLQVTNTLLSTR